MCPISCGQVHLLHRQIPSHSLVLGDLQHFFPTKIVNKGEQGLTEVHHSNAFVRQPARPVIVARRKRLLIRHRDSIGSAQAQKRLLWVNLRAE